MNARRWFVELDGRAQGPFSESQVQDLARLKKINPLTKIFAEGDVRWRLMNEFDEFKIAPEPVGSLQNREWVVLKRKTLKEAELSQNKFDQIGPFTIDEIVEQIKTGDLSYNDYAWKKGFQRWAKLESLSEFNHTVKAPAVPRIPEPPPMAFVNEPKLELNQEEQQELDHFTATNSKILASEDVTVVQPKVDVKKEAKADLKKKEKPVGGKKKAVRAVEEQIANADSSIQIRGGLSTGRKVWRAALASAAAVVVSFAAYSFIKQNQTPIDSAAYEPPAAARASQPVTENSPAQAPQPAELQPPPPAIAAEVVQPQAPTFSGSIPTEKPTKKPSQLPSKAYSKADYEMPKNPRLEFEVIKPESVGQVVFSTNAPVNFPVEVKVSGKSGQILRYASYVQNLKVMRQNGEVPSIQLSNLKAPFGTYTIQAKFNEVTKQKTFFYGVKDTKFQKDLQAHQKKIAPEQIAEKKMVFYFLRDLENTTKTLESQRQKAGQNQNLWVKAYSSWRKDVTKSNNKSFASLRSMNNRDLAYPDMITKAKELAQSLLKQGGEMNAAVMQNRYMSSSGVGPILTQIRDFKREVAAMSVNSKQ